MGKTSNNHDLDKKDKVLDFDDLIFFVCSAEDYFQELRTYGYTDDQVSIIRLWQLWQ